MLGYVLAICAALVRVLGPPLLVLVFAQNGNAAPQLSLLSAIPGLIFASGVAWTAA